MLDRIQKAKDSGLTLRLCYTTIAFTGSSAAGKTSFFKLLNKKKFTIEHHSTNVAESKQIVYSAGIVGSGIKSQWVELSHETMLEQLGSYLKTHTKMSYQSLEDENIESHSTKCQVEDNIAEKASESDFSIEKSPSLGDVWKMINFLDTGGQPEFINLFPSISTSIVLTFIILNMCGGVKSLDELVKVIHREHDKQSYEPYHLHYTNLDLIKLLMAFSKDSSLKTKSPLSPMECKNKNTSTSYQCYVGSHADEVSKEEIQTIESKLKHTADELKCSKQLWELDKKVLFPVDNTTAGGENEDPIAGIIRTRIQELVENSNIYEVPITWFILLLEMQKNCAERDVSFLSYMKAVEICKIGNLSKDEKEVQSALLFFHHMGIILYYHEVPGMCQYVIINHQWLFEKLTSLVNLTFERKGYDIDAITKFENEGQLSRSLIEQINLDAGVNTESFVALLQHLKIVAKINKQEYFMPCVLHSFKSITSNILDQHGNIQYTELLVHFLSNPLPRGFFCCLVVEVCQNLPKNWLLPLLSTTYNNLITFHTSDTGHSISLIDKIGCLEIQIRHKKNSPPIHYDVQCFLSKSFDQVCSHLQLDNKQFYFGFLCNCGHTMAGKNHIASFPKELDPVPYWIKCSHSRIELTPSHLIWLQPPQKVISTSIYHPHAQKIFKNFYPELTATLFSSDLSSYFVQKDIISMDDEELIDKATTNKEKAKIVLHIINSHLEGGYIDSFKDMLDIMENRGTKPVADLALKIKSELKLS